LGAAVPVIVAIIGVSGVILPAFSTTLINQIYNKPNLEIDISRLSESVIGKQNSGTIPATNLSLIIDANNKISNDITNVFSTVNVTLVTPGFHSLLAINHPEPIGDYFAQLHVKKFVNIIKRSRNYR
jgi:hypothetical protein